MIIGIYEYITQKKIDIKKINELNDVDIIFGKNISHSFTGNTSIIYE